MSFQVFKQTVVHKMSYLVGNPFPVIEHHKDKKDSLRGAPLKAGYQSHYVLTDKNGDPWTASQSECFNEIVIPQVQNFC